jgi:ATP-dependent Clp protease ATP-binding subunit ClpB
MEQRIWDSLRSTFKPEFLNRVDEIIIFQSLSSEQISQIVDIQVDRLRKRLEDKKIDLKLSDSARQFLAQKGYDPAYGARPLKRAIQKYIENPLAMELLSGNIHPGNTVVAEAEEENLVFYQKPLNSND